MRSSYLGKRVLVTGGLGFIGSNLALSLHRLGARVTVVDSLADGCGATWENLRESEHEIEIVPVDIAEVDRFRPLLQQAEVIFNLAGEVGHLESMKDTQRDFRLNVVSHLRFLQECTAVNPGVRIVYTCTRQVYGAPQYVPVDEAHPVNPVDYNGVHKLTTANYHLMLGRVGLLDPIVLRLTNVYGPRMGLWLSGQGFLSTFLQRVLRGMPMEVFADGSAVRDPVYVDDVVEALLRAGHCQTPRERLYNIGGPAAVPLRRIAEVFSAAAGGTPITYREFPEELRRIDIGHYYTDHRLAQSQLQWTPVISLEDGVKRTLEFYRSGSRIYLEPPPASAASASIR